MQEFEYRLEKEDYKNWIHWNVLKHESKKMKMSELRGGLRMSTKPIRS